MKIKTGTIIWIIAGFIWSIFMGVTATAIGLGALFPPINQVASPFVCPNGQMNYQEEASNPLPGTTYTQITWYCVDQKTGAKTELEIFPMTLYSGAFYGLLIFVAVLVIWYFNNRRNVSLGLAGDKATVEQAAQSGNQARQYDRFPSGLNERRARIAEKAEIAKDALARMKTLKELRAANMISETEYEQKRAEILKDV
ncbi:MAG: SHOCT domain-containing protein [Anaerolineae bacterium]